MLTFEEMITRIGISMLLGLIIGLERELIGKEAGLKTNTLVTVSSTIFSIAGLSLPYIISENTNNLAEVISRNSGFLALIANIAVGIGFLGAGVIVKENGHVRSVTTAAVIWFAASIGVLCGIGLIKLAIVTTLAMVLILFILMRLEPKIPEIPKPSEKENK